MLSINSAHTDSFYRSIRNLVIDLRDISAPNGTGIHWQVSQATSLYNIVVEMSDANNTGTWSDRDVTSSRADVADNRIPPSLPPSSHLPYHSPPRLYRFAAQKGLYMEDGSGGFMADLVFNGGMMGPLGTFDRVLTFVSCRRCRACGW